MGWCSGTPIFDHVFGHMLSINGLQTDHIVQVTKELIVAMEDNDWDCQSDSQYYDHPLVKHVMKQLHPDWFEGHDDQPTASTPAKGIE